MAQNHLPKKLQDSTPVWVGEEKMGEARGKPEGKEDFSYVKKKKYIYIYICIVLPCGPVVKNPPANTRDTGSIPGLGRSHMPQGS